MSAHVLDRILDYFYTVLCNVALENKEQLFPIVDQYEDLGVLHNHQFKDLLAEVLEAILCDNKLNVHNKELVIKVVTKWTEAGLQAQEQCFNTLIHCVKYGLMSFSLYTEVMNNKLSLAILVCFY
jgi:hypothetical protein